MFKAFQTRTPPGNLHNPPLKLPFPHKALYTFAPNRYPLLPQYLEYTRTAINALARFMYDLYPFPQVCIRLASR